MDGQRGDGRRADGDGHRRDTEQPEQTEQTERTERATHGAALPTALGHSFLPVCLPACLLDRPRGDRQGGESVWDSPGPQKGFLLLRNAYSYENKNKNKRKKRARNETNRQRLAGTALLPPPSQQKPPSLPRELSVTDGLTG